MIKIADQVELPLDAITQTFAEIGKRGAGKTYLATMIAEQMLDAKAQIIVLDSVGIWWGLRLAADGMNKGKDIFIIGGERGDIDVVPEAGKEIARLLAEKPLSVVLDISGFRKHERKKFCTDFAEEFYHLKKTHRSPVHIFVEEAQLIIPQTMKGPDEARMVGAWEDIIRLGRNWGIGCSLISQRPQSVNKEVLSQTECLCVLQVTGTHERKALDEWIQEAEADRKIVNELPGLKKGEGYVWSPSWLRIFQRVNFNKKTTFDSSKTPEIGEEKVARNVKLSQADIKKLREVMKGIVEDAKIKLKEKKDLEAEIKRLNAELKKRPTETKVKEVFKVDEAQLERERKIGFNEGAKTTETAYKQNVNELKAYIKKLEGKIQKIGTIIGAETKAPEASPIIDQMKPIYTNHYSKQPYAIEKETKAGLVTEMVSPPDLSEVKLKAGAMRMLNFIAMFTRLTRQKTKTLAGISNSSTFSTYVQDLKRAGCINLNGSILEITSKGIEIIGQVEQMPTDTESLITLWSKFIKAGAVRMLRICVNEYPNTITRDELRQAAGIENPSTFSTYVQDLKRNSLININGQEIKASEELFE